MKRIFLLTSLFLTIICKVTATVQTRELIVIKGDTLRLSSYPLGKYLFDNNVEIKDIPGLSEGLSTDCWRGYVGVWLIENNKLYLTEIRDCDYNHRNNRRVADLSKMFGERYEEGKVLAEWYSDSLYVQYGNYIYKDRLLGSICAREKTITVSKGMVTRNIDYSTLTGTDQSGFIRIWNGKEIDTRNVVPGLGELVRENFQWSDAMTTHQDITIIFYIDDDCSNVILTETEYEKFWREETVQSFQENYNQTGNGNTKVRIAEMIESGNKKLIEYEAAIKEEYQYSGVYVDELKRILVPAKVETLLYCGKPYLRIFEHSYSFDPENKTIKVYNKQRNAPK